MWKRAATMEDVLREADVISPHPVLDKTTYHLINKECLAITKKEAILVNARSHVLVSLKLQILFSTVDAPASHGFLKVKALLSLLMPMETYMCMKETRIALAILHSLSSTTNLSFLLHLQSNKAYTNKPENKVSCLEEENERLKKQKVLDASCTCLTSYKIH